MKTTHAIFGLIIGVGLGGGFGSAYGQPLLGMVVGGIICLRQSTR